MEEDKPESKRAVTRTTTQGQASFFPKYFPETAIGFVVNIICALLYDQFKTTVGPLTIFVCILAVVTLTQILLFRYATNKIGNYFATREAAMDRVYKENEQRNAKQVEEHYSTAVRTAQTAASQLQSALTDANSRYSKARAARSELLHTYVHRARDLGVRLLPHAAQPGAVLSEKLCEVYAINLTRMLEMLSALFRELAPEGTRVWVALRVRKDDNKFHTWIRMGNYRENRQSSSEPLSEDSNIVRSLRTSFNDHGNPDCVILTGPGHPEWQPMENDKIGENKSVLLGAVFTKFLVSNESMSFSKEPDLTWILCVNADKEGAFTEDHKPLMRCCNDVMSWLVNELARHPKQTGQSC